MIDMEQVKKVVASACRIVSENAEKIQPIEYVGTTSGNLEQRFQLKFRIGGYRDEFTVIIIKPEVI